ncbi:MAG: type 2 lantipeptide synthetase LanM [Hamadaea sp.]|nr:type 2 lantipeptide synthetase LanM [Hamadaea sp.]
MELPEGWWQPAEPTAPTPPAWALFAADAIRAAPSESPTIADGITWETGFATVFASFTATAERQARDAPGFAAMLGHRLARLAARTLILELHSARQAGRLRGPTPTARFAYFIAQAARKDDLASLLVRYPVLGRILGQACVHAAAASAELIDRLTCDRDAIVGTLLGGRDPGPLVRISFSEGDRHGRGRAVAVVRFATGAQVVYKPRPLTVNAHFNDLIATLAPRLGELTPATAAVLTRLGYGWSQFVAAEPSPDPDGVRRFYRRQGALLAVLYALDANDMHCENVIARGDEPVVVDLETLFHPHDTPLATVGDDPALAALSASVHRTGLLPALRVGDEAAVDLSGLGGDRGVPSPSPSLAFADAGTDRMRVVREVRTTAGSANRPVLNGIEADPADHLDDLLDGFRRAYRELIAGRAELTAPDGPLAHFAADQVRVVVRPTQLYSTLLDESTHPHVLRDAAARDDVFGLLSPPEPEVGSNPATALFERELDDLWHGDVPYFWTRPSTDELFDSHDRPIPGFRGAAGLTRATAKLAGMGAADLQRQEWIIRAAMACRDRSDPHVTAADAGHSTNLADIPDRTRISRRPPLSRAAADPLTIATGISERVVTTADPLTVATGIGERLLTTAERSGGRLNWLGLELVGHRFWQVGPLGAALGNGYTGVALFLAQLSVLTGRGEFAEAARRAVTPIPGLLAGIGASPDDVATVGPGGFDGFGGIAYGLTRIASCLADPEIFSWVPPAVELTVQSGLQTIEPSPSGVFDGLAGGIAALLAVHRMIGLADALHGARQLGNALVTRALPEAAGFAHGTSGVQWALTQVGLPAAPSSALAQESADTGRIDLSWCRGAAGSALAGLAPPPEPGPLLPSDALCHGELGLIDALPAPDRDKRLAAVIERIQQDGPRCATPGAVPSSGLVTGLAGIGYGLLRAAHPDEVPSVQLLHPAC